jgi:hypothetical protein
MLAPFALIFANFNEAINYLIQELDECERFRYFQKVFSRFFRRCRIIAENIVHHVGLAIGCGDFDIPCVEVAWRFLRNLIAGENFALDTWNTILDGFHRTLREINMSLKTHLLPFWILLGPVCWANMKHRPPQDGQKCEEA